MRENLKTLCGVRARSRALREVSGVEENRELPAPREHIVVFGEVGAWRHLVVHVTFGRLYSAQVHKVVRAFVGREVDEDVRTIDGLEILVAYVGPAFRLDEAHYARGRVRECTGD